MKNTRAFGWAFTVGVLLVGPKFLLAGETAGLPLLGIEGELGLRHDFSLAIVGMGNLGRALAAYRGFAERGFRVIALLDGDAKVVPVQGHLIMLRDQVPADLQSMILVYFNEAKTPSGQKAKRSFYIFPKQLPGSGPNDVGVVGGTFIEGATPDTPNDEE